MSVYSTNVQSDIMVGYLFKRTLARESALLLRVYTQNVGQETDIF